MKRYGHLAAATALALLVVLLAACASPPSGSEPPDGGGGPPSLPGAGAMDVWTHVRCPDAPNSGKGFHRLTSFDDLPNDPLGDGENNCYMEAFDTSVFSTDGQPLSGCGNLDLDRFPEHACVEVRTGEDFRQALSTPGRRVALIMNDLEVDRVPYIAGDEQSIYLIGLYDPGSLRPVLVKTAPGVQGTLVNWSSTADPHFLAVINLRLHTGGMCFSVGRRQVQGTYVFQSVTAKCNGRFIMGSYETPTRASWSGGTDYPNSVPDLTRWPVDDRVYFRRVMTRGNRSHTVYLDRSYLNWVEDSIVMLSFTSGKHAAKFEAQNVYLHDSIFTNTGLHNEAISDPEFSDTPRRSNLAALSLAACSRVVLDHVTVPYHYERAEANARPIQWQIRDSLGGACDLPWSYYPNTYPAVAYHGPAEWRGRHYAATPFWDPDWWASIDDDDPLDPNMITSMVLSSRIHVTAEAGFDTAHLFALGSVGTYPTTREDSGSAGHFHAPDEVPAGWKERQRILVNNNCLDDGIPLENATQNYSVAGMQDPADPSRHRYDNTDKFVVVGSQSCADVGTPEPWLLEARDRFLDQLPSPPWNEWK